jgi:glucose-6-phosphate isomerase
MINHTISATWQQLQEHHQEIFPLHMRDLFAQDNQRFNKYSLQFKDVLLDYSKNRMTDHTLKLLFQLARESNIETWRERMFTGEKINFTEDRAVLHRPSQP